MKPPQSLRSREGQLQEASLSPSSLLDMLNVDSLADQVMSPTGYFRRASRAEPLCAGFKNNLGEGKIPAVRDRQQNILYAHFIRSLPREALKL
jgi:hypothetical protein